MRSICFDRHSTRVTPLWVTRVALFLAASIGVLLSAGCFGGRTGSPTAGLPEAIPAAHPIQAPLDSDYLARFLIFSGLSEQSAAEERQLLLDHPQSLTKKEFQDQAGAWAKRMETMLGGTLSKADRRLMHAQGRVLLSFAALRKKEFKKALALSRAILEAPRLSPQLYQWALSVQAITQTLAWDATAQEPESGQEPEATLRPSLFARDFNSLHTLLCNQLCDTPGWATLAAEEATVLSQSGFTKHILSSAQFAAAGALRPAWVGGLLGERKALKDRGAEADSSDEALAKTPDGQPSAAGLPTSSFSKDLRRMKALMDAQRIPDASRLARKVTAFVKAPTGRSGKEEPLQFCDSTFIYAQYVLAQANRFAQNKTAFLQHQQRLVDLLETQRLACSSASFDMDSESFEAFLINARLWLARLLWEQSKPKEAATHANFALSEAEKHKLWDLYLEAAQVLIGRVGFETLLPADNLKILLTLEKKIPEIENPEFALWVHSRKGLFLFLDAQFADAARTFSQLESLPGLEAGNKAFAQYWKGRSLKALKQDRLAENSFLSTGLSEPLGLFDALSGQILGLQSGRVSSPLLSPFAQPWPKELDRWISLKSNVPFVLFRPFVWIRDNLTGAQEVNGGPDDRASRLAFQDGLSNAILLATSIRASGRFSGFEAYSEFLRESDEPVVRLLKSEIVWLKNRYQSMAKNAAIIAPPPGHEKIAWLLYTVGDYVNAILFVGSLRDKVVFETEETSFFYFIFYPRPFVREMQQAAAKCKVDVDLLYAVARQESLFQTTARSPVGAVGLLQLMPATAKRVLNAHFKGDFAQPDTIDLTNAETNTLAGACYLADLLERYQGNVIFAVAAYNAGEGQVDKWIAGRNKLKDIPLFMEFIPYAETKKYVQRVMRNYYNMKWIYALPEPGAF